jgi:hypothetical protein
MVARHVQMTLKKKLAHLTTKNFKHQLATSLVRKQQTTTT